VIDFLRKQRNPAYLGNAVDNNKKVMETLADENDLPDKSVEKKEWYQILKEIVQKLSARDRYLFELSYNQELPDIEVAQIMNLSISAIYMRKSRIKKKLKDVIEKKKTL
jgi:RNA polymerase sigma factor (sigma-70 family)